MAITTMPMTGPITAPAIQSLDGEVCITDAPVDVVEASADAPLPEAVLDAVVAEDDARSKPGVGVEVVSAVSRDTEDDA